LRFFSKIIGSTAAACFLITQLASCKPSEAGGENEGIIEFDTKAIDQTHPLAGLAPGSATLKYKNDKFVMEMSTMGMFNTAIIGNITEKTMVQTVKFMDIKQACVENEKDIQSENDRYKLKIEETKETKKILGFKCIKLKVTMVENPSVVFDAYYTKDLGMPDCNALTPYAEVKGVLLDYRAKKMGMELHFIAKKHKKEAIPENVFEIPAYMRIVSKEAMTKFFTDLQ